MKSIRIRAMGGVATFILLFALVAIMVPESVAYAGPHGGGSGTSGTSAGDGTSGTSAGSGAASSGTQSSGTVEFPNPTPFDSVMDLLEEVLRAIVRILMPVIAIMLIVSGFLFVTAGGNETKLELAKKTLFGTIVGAAIVLGSWALATAIAGTIQGL